jgi:hypothetical protein
MQAGTCDLALYLGHRTLRLSSMQEICSCRSRQEKPKTHTQFRRH